jgi:hypothetical protein
MEKLQTIILEFIPYVTMAMLGGIARVVMTKTGERRSPSFILGEMFLAIFATLIMVQLIQSFVPDIRESIVNAVAGLTGYTAKSVLQLLENKFLVDVEKKLGNDIKIEK